MTAQEVNDIRTKNKFPLNTIQTIVQNRTFELNLAQAINYCTIITIACFVQYLLYAIFLLVLIFAITSVISWSLAAKISISVSILLLFTYIASVHTERHINKVYINHKLEMCNDLLLLLEGVDNMEDWQKRMVTEQSILPYAGLYRESNPSDKK